MSLPLAMALSGLDEEQFGSDLKYLYDHGARLLQPLNSSVSYQCDQPAYYVMSGNGGDPYEPIDEGLQPRIPRLAYWDFLNRIDNVMLQRLNPRALLAQVSSAWPPPDVPLTDMPSIDTPSIDTPSFDTLSTAMLSTPMPSTSIQSTTMPSTALVTTAMPSRIMTSTEMSLTSTPSRPKPQTSTFLTSTPSTSKPSKSLHQQTSTSEPVIKYGNRDILDLGNNIGGSNTWNFQPAKLHDISVVPRRLIPENRSQYFRTQNKYLCPKQVETCPIDDCKFNTVHYN